MLKAEKRVEQERLRRHANIRRGMRIAIYEINQILAEHGAEIKVPPGWVDYTVALAEGGRRKAPFADIVDRITWTVAMKLRERAAARSRAFVALMRSVFG